MSFPLFVSCFLIIAPLTPNFAFEIIPSSPSSHHLGYGEWNIAIDGELTLMQQFLKAGSLVFDVGGNHGEWSLYALKTQPSLQIIAFEPVPEVFQSLQNTLQNAPNVRLFNCALSDEIGFCNFHYYFQADGLSSFFFREVLRYDQPEPQLISVEQTTLDDFCSKQSIAFIDFIKIDTEGAESKILHGAASLIQNHQIGAIQFEYGGCYIDAQTTLHDTIKFLADNRYLVFRIIPSGLVHISQWEDSLENYHLSNYFAIREEDLHGYSLCSNL